MHLRNPIHNLTLPLFLLPAFLLVNVSAAAANSKGKITYNLAPCAKTCRSEFLGYCRSISNKAKPAKVKIKRAKNKRSPTQEEEDRGGSNSAQDKNAFYRCMCIDRSGVQYMDGCGWRCNRERDYDGDADPDLPEQTAELRRWWGGWCERKKQKLLGGATGSASTDGGLDVEGMVLVDEGKSKEGNSNSGVKPPPPYDNFESHSEAKPIPPYDNIGTPKKNTLLTPDTDKDTQRDKPKDNADDTKPKDGPKPSTLNATLVTATASVAFAGGCMFLSYLMLMRRSKYARRRGVLAWMRLKMIERGYRRGGDGAGSLGGIRSVARVGGVNGIDGIGGIAGTRSKVGRRNGRLELLGNPKWLNDRPVPALPHQTAHAHARKAAAGSKGFGSVEDFKGRNTRPGFLARVMGRGVDDRRGGAAGVRKSKRYSQGWINATKMYTDVEETDEKSKGYFRSKGISTYKNSGPRGEYAGIGTAATSDTAAGGGSSGLGGPETGPVLISEPEGDINEKRYGDGGLTAEDAEEEQEQEYGLGGVIIDEEDEEEGGEEEETIRAQGRGRVGYDGYNYYDSYSSLNERDGRPASSTTPTCDSSGNGNATDDANPLAAISATPQLTSMEWDSWSGGADMGRIDATGGLKGTTGGYGYGSGSGVGGGASSASTYSTGGLSFDDVDLIDDDRYGSWNSLPRLGTGSSGGDYATLGEPDVEWAERDRGPHGYGPIIPIIEPDGQHARRMRDVEGAMDDSFSSTKSRLMKGKIKWKVKGKGGSGYGPLPAVPSGSTAGSKGFLGMGTGGSKGFLGMGMGPKGKKGGSGSGSGSAGGAYGAI